MFICVAAAKYERILYEFAFERNNFYFDLKMNDE
jgi:hypothetical protein